MVRHHKTYRSSKSIHWCDLCAWERPKKTEKETWQWKTGYSLRPPTSLDLNEILHGGWSSAGSSKVWISSKSVKQFPRCGGWKLSSPIALAIGLYNSLFYYTWLYISTAFALTPLVGCQEEHLARACKKLSNEVLEWLSVWNAEKNHSAKTV